MGLWAAPISELLTHFWLGLCPWKAGTCLGTPTSWRARCTHKCSSSGQGISLTIQWPWDQANQQPSGEKATLQVSQLDFQSNWCGRPGLSSASSSGSSVGAEGMAGLGPRGCSHPAPHPPVPVATGRCHLSARGQEPWPWATFQGAYSNLALPTTGEL